MRIIYFVLILFLFCTTAFGDEKINLEQAVKDLSSENYDTRLKAKKLIENSGLRAIPHLRKVMKAEDLETKEVAEKKIAENFIYKDNKFKPINLIGSDPNMVSTRKYIDEYYVWLTNVFLKSFEENSLKDPRWNNQLKKLIIMWTEFYKNLDIDMLDNEDFVIGRGFRKNEMEIRKSINELTTLGCDDPLFIFLKHSLYYAWYDFRFSIEKLIKASDDLIKLNYSNYFKFYSNMRDIAIKSKHPDWDSDNPEKNNKGLNVYNIWLEMGKEEVFKSRIGQRKYVQWFKQNFLFEFNISDLENNLDKISKNIGKDSWGDHVIKALLYIKKAEFHRSNGKIELAKKENLKVFYANLTEAETHALAAYQINSDYPEPMILMIEILTARQKDEKIRPFFEKAIQGGFDNPNIFSIYREAMEANQTNAVESIRALGKEYLTIDNPNVNTAKFYLHSLLRIKWLIGEEIYKWPGILKEVEWAVEQQISAKPVYPSLYYNLLIMVAYLNKDFQKTWQAIQEAKGLFSVSWFSYNFDFGGAIIERFVNLTQKYKNKKTIKSLIAVFHETNTTENRKIILNNFKIEIETIDQPKVVNLIMNSGNHDIIDSDEGILNLLHSFGYREPPLVAYMYLLDEYINKNLKDRFVQAYGLKTIESIELLRETEIISPEAHKNLERKIKEIFMKGVKDERDLEKNDEYLKAQIRGYLYFGIKEENVEQYEGIISEYAKKINNIGDLGDFLSAYLLYKGSPYRSWLQEIFNNHFLNTSEQNIIFIKKEIQKLAAIEDNKKFYSEIQNTWKIKGNPLMVFEMVNLLRQRGLNFEAEVLINWLFYCFESFSSYNLKSNLLQALSLYPGYSKEAYQLGVMNYRDGYNSAYYLIGYHVFKLGHFHMAYEYLCEGQTLREPKDGYVLNKVIYKNSNDLLQAIVNEMLATKDLPEYIRFNLKDQFDVKFKK